jgi:uncharacterized RDD family membrane protein YckC
MVVSCLQVNSGVRRQHTSMSDYDVSSSPMIDDEIASPRYATFTRRFRAVLVDSAVVSTACVLLLIVGGFADNVPGSGRIVLALMVGLVFLYEPIFIWRRGATIGHAANNLRVLDDRTGRPPGFARSFIRYIIKLVLGLPSFITMAFTRRHQAVHDVLTRTTVQPASIADVEEHDFHLERIQSPEVVLPSRLRRVSVMIAYLAGVFLIYGVILVALDPENCASNQSCTGSTKVVVEGGWFAWLAISVAIVVAAWKGLLLGARQRRLASIDAPVG